MFLDWTFVQLRRDSLGTRFRKKNLHLEFCTTVRLQDVSYGPREGPHRDASIRDRLRLDVRISQLTTGCRTGESATVRDITEQYRSIRHLLHVDPAFQLSKQLRDPSAFCSRAGDRRTAQNGVRSTAALALEFVESLVRSLEELARSRFADVEWKIRHMTGPPTHLWGPNTAQRDRPFPSPVFTTKAPLQVDQPGLLADPRWEVRCEKRFVSLEAQNWARNTERFVKFQASVNDEFLYI